VDKKPEQAYEGGKMSDESARASSRDTRLETLLLRAQIAIKDMGGKTREGGKRDWERWAKMKWDEKQKKQKERALRG